MFDHGSLLGNVQDVYRNTGKSVAQILALQKKRQEDVAQKQELMGSHVV